MPLYRSVLKSVETCEFSFVPTPLRLVVLALPFLLAEVAFSQPLPSSVSDSIPSDVFVPDFSYAGYAFGLEEIPRVKGTVMDVEEFGATPDDEKDDTGAIQKALVAARGVEGSVVVAFPAGRFIVTEILELDRSDLVMRGSGCGENGTVLYFPRPLAMVDDKGKFAEIREYLQRYNKRQKEKDKNLDVLFSEYSWTGGFIWVGRSGHRSARYLEELDRPIPLVARSVDGVRGERTLRVDDVSALRVGERIQILWYNRAGEDGPLLREIYGDTDEKIGSHHWTFENRPLVQQRTRVERIEGKVITIADPLLHNLSEAVPAEIARWSPLQNVGIEDFRFEFPDSPFFGHHVEQGFNGIHLSDLVDGWVRSVSFVNADSGILTYDSANLTLSDIQTLGERRGHYAVHMGNVHNVLAERVQVFNPVIHSLTFNTQSTRCVYKDAQVFKESVLDQHAGSNHQNLFDNATLHVSCERKGDVWVYPVFDGSGTGYWQPGHGQFNTTWNLRVFVTDGAMADEIVLLEGLAEGPDARIFGLSGNREFRLDYRPTPVVSHMNSRIEEAPSLYDYQLRMRKQ